MKSLDIEDVKEREKDLPHNPSYEDYKNALFVSVRNPKNRCDNQTIKYLLLKNPEIFANIKFAKKLPSGTALFTEHAQKILETFPEGVEVTHPGNKNAEGQLIPYTILFQKFTERTPLNRSQDCKIIFTDIDPKNWETDGYKEALAKSVLNPKTEPHNTVLSTEWQKLSGLETKSGTVEAIYKFFPHFAENSKNTLNTQLSNQQNLLQHPQQPVSTTKKLENNNHIFLA